MNNSSGLISNDATITNNSLGTFSNGFCARLTNNSTFTNNGDLFNCGLIDGTTGITGNAPITSSCGNVLVDATLEVHLTDFSTGDPLSDAIVSLERSCLPLASPIPFVEVTGGVAHFFRGALEPGQYVLKVCASGFSPLTGRPVLLQSMQDGLEVVALTPNPEALNTLVVDITVDTGASLVTSD